MKKALIILLILIPAFLPAYEHTGGARLDLNLKGPDIYGTIAEASSENRFGLWYEGKVNDLINISIDAGAAYEGYAGVAVDFNQEISYLGLEGEWYPDIKAVNVFGYTGIFDYRVGRQHYSDPSGLIISQAIDALDAGVLLGPGILRGSLGYSGLVHKKASHIAMTKSDFDGSRRLIEGLSYSYPEILGSYMSLRAGITAQQDLIQKEDIAAGSDSLDTLYLQLGIEGFLLPSVMYGSNFIYQTGQYGDLKSRGYLTDFQLLLVPGGMNSYLSLRALRSSGESWDNRSDYYGLNAAGDQNQFIPISTAGSVGYVMQLDPGNITAFELLLSLSKNKKFAFELSTTTLMRTVDGPVSSTMIIDNGIDNLFIGQEGLMTFRFRPVSDFGASVKAGVLYPGESITINEYLEDYLPVLPKIGFDLSFSF